MSSSAPLCFGSDGQSLPRVSYIDPTLISHTFLGSRFGFIGGSTDASNLQALHACLVINLSAAAGGLTWMLIDRLRQGIWSPVSFCSGVLVALIAATPGAGVVPAPAGLAFGIISAVVCNFATVIKVWLRCDDALGIVL